MPNVTLTTFVDFVAATGPPRVTKVRNAKELYGQDYEPAHDFYKQLREGIEDCVANGWDSQALKKSRRSVSDDRKIENFEDCRTGFTKWVGRKKLAAKPTLRSDWKSGSLRVAVNPELHVDINGTPHLIKLYFKGDKLSKQKADVSLHLLQTMAPTGTTVGLLDVRRSRLIAPTRVIAGMDALLKAEAVAFVSLWGSV
jgi:hypothetical protein